MSDYWILFVSIFSVLIYREYAVLLWCTHYLDLTLLLSATRRTNISSEQHNTVEEKKSINIVQINNNQTSVQISSSSKKTSNEKVRRTGIEDERQTIKILSKLKIEPQITWVIVRSDKKPNLIHFSVRGFDQYGNDMPTGSLKWETSSGTIDSFGCLLIDDKSAVGFHQVIVSAKGRVKYSTKFRNTLLTLGLATKISSWIVYNESFFYDILNQLLSGIYLDLDGNEEISMGEILLEDLLIDLGRKYVAKIMSKVSQICLDEYSKEIFDNAFYLVISAQKKEIQVIPQTDVIDCPKQSDTTKIELAYLPSPKAVIKYKTSDINISKSGNTNKTEFVDRRELSVVPKSTLVNNNNLNRKTYTTEENYCNRINRENREIGIDTFFIDVTGCRTVATGEIYYLYIIEEITIDTLLVDMLGFRDHRIYEKLKCLWQLAIDQIDILSLNGLASLVVMFTFAYKEIDMNNEIKSEVAIKKAVDLLYKISCQSDYKPHPHRDLEFFNSFLRCYNLYLARFVGA